MTRFYYVGDFSNTAEFRSLSLMGETLLTKKIPSRTRLLGGIKNAAQNLIKNPRKTIREGLLKDKAANETWTRATGLGRKATTGKLVKAVGNGMKPVVKTLAVNTGKAIGGSVGNVGGLPGRVAGDWLGAYTVRRGINDAAATGKAIKKYAGKEMNPVRKVQKISKASVNNSRQGLKREKFKYLDDSVGQGIGRSVGETAALHPVTASASLSGAAAVTMPSTAPVSKGLLHTYKRRPQVGLKQAGKEGLRLTRRRLKRAFTPQGGNLAEQYARRRTNGILGKVIPDTASNLSFSSVDS